LPRRFLFHSLWSLHAKALFFRRPKGQRRIRTHSSVITLSNSLNIEALNYKENWYHTILLREEGSIRLNFFFIKTGTSPASKRKISFSLFRSLRKR
jgi:hypothetical protein